MTLKQNHNDENLYFRKFDLAKVLWYYNLIPDIRNSVQKIVCPFHEDASPSLQVNIEDGTWYCFGCGKSGDAIKFVYFMENKNREKKINELEALKIYFRILKSKKCSDIKPERFKKRHKPSDRELYSQAYDYYHGLKKVLWGFTDGEEEKLAFEYLNKRGFTKEVLNKSKCKITYNKSYPIIFPLIDNGKFKGWVCRTTTPEIEKKRKYLYNEGFSRATTLVGEYGKTDYVFVVEGYMDRLKFVQYGYTNVVAILGWKMSDEQIKKLKNKGITKVISALDNDECGRRGTKYLRNFFDVTRFCYLKGVKDPGEMTQKLFDKMFRKTMEVFNNGTAGKH